MDFSNENITHVKKDNGIEYITFKVLEKYNDKLTHAFFTRKGGASCNTYSSLNVRLASKDNEEYVRKNIIKICKELKIKELNIYKANQAHTDKILVLNSKNKGEYLIGKENSNEFDGYVTNEKNIATMVTTADCNPIIIYDPVKNVVANIHSGWKGTVKKIYIKAVEKMINEFGTKKEDVIVCIGPSIGKCCFSSKDNELKNKFISIWNYEKEYISKVEGEEKGRFHIDFPYVISKDLVEFGLKKENVVSANICTCCNEEYFFSYRKNTINKEKDYATQATVACIK